MLYRVSVGKSEGSMSATAVENKCRTNGFLTKSFTPGKVKALLHLSCSEMLLKPWSSKYVSICMTDV
jgi:hypothetical protein